MPAVNYRANFEVTDNHRPGRDEYDPLLAPAHGGGQVVALATPLNRCRGAGCASVHMYGLPVRCFCRWPVGGSRISSLKDRTRF